MGSFFIALIGIVIMLLARGNDKAVTYNNNVSFNKELAASTEFHKRNGTTLGESTILDKFEFKREYLNKRAPVMCALREITKELPVMDGKLGLPHKYDFNSTESETAYFFYSVYTNGQCPTVGGSAPEMIMPNAYTEDGKNKCFFTTEERDQIAWWVIGKMREHGVLLPDQGLFRARDDADTVLKVSDRASWRTGLFNKYRFYLCPESVRYYKLMDIVVLR